MQAAPPAKLSVPLQQFWRRKIELDGFPRNGCQRGHFWRGSQKIIRNP